MLVSIANKLGKKFGAKVGTTELTGRNISQQFHELEVKINAGTATIDERKTYQHLLEGTKKLNQEVWSLPITPEMKEAVMTKGQPLFT